MRNFIVFLCLFSFGFLTAQDAGRILLKGKVNSDLTELDGIYVMNIRTDKTVATSQGGYFSIMAQPGDTLMFSAIQFQGKSVQLKKADFEGDLFFVRLEGMINTIDEVKIIQYNNINAVSLGIIPKGQKKYTSAERKLQTASGYGGIGSAASLDPLINWMSGRTAMLKKEVAVEKKEILLAKIDQMFEEEYFTQTLKIPALYVRGFWYYAIEDQKFVAAVNNKNK